MLSHRRKTRQDAAFCGLAALRRCDVAGPDQMLLPLLLIAPTLVMAMASGVN